MSRAPVAAIRQRKMNENVYQAASAMTEISKFINLPAQQTDTPGRRLSVFGTFLSRVHIASMMDAPKQLAVNYFTLFSSPSCIGSRLER